MTGTHDLNANRVEERERAERWRETALRGELVERIGRAVSQDGSVEPLPGLHLARVSSTKGPIHGAATPSFCIIAQGAKEIYLGEECYRYDAYRYLLATVEMPVVSRLVEASPERPYLSFRMNLDPALVASVLLDANLPTPPRKTGSARAVDVSPLDVELLDATVRFVRLLDASPTEARVLQPLVTREIILRLLVGEQSGRLRHLTVQGGHTERIDRAIQRLSQDFHRPLRIESLARELGMSPSGFHDQFKAVTAMSPLQFLKQLRLQEARRLMLGEDIDAATAAYRVGYEDASHFNREYKRHFGHPPRRDVQRLRSASETVSAEV